MTLEEIFNEDGQYTSDDFIDGFCIEIKNGIMLGNQYRSKDDIFPERWTYTLYKSLFSHNYRKVLTRQSLFRGLVMGSEQADA